ncbi:cilia- and flagella-associated protein 61-like [Stomoxys calcitrans]|uniref:cilia- and flagella-associated protein 61-like n=1 Tax=Stomoxys calcitrans TaxID=35570 RepID=UPI0027E39FD0|nr:cilia- and flagella-associated protein 61-like [Stomoxys calcitrans]
MEAFGNQFYIRDANPEDNNDIYEFFATGGNVCYFGETRRKLKKPKIYFSKYITHRIIVYLREEPCTIIGYAEISNAPYRPALPEDCWENWLSKHYCTQLPLNSGNTMFLNTFIYNKIHNPALLQEVLGEIFLRENKIRYVIVVQCPDYGFRNEKKRPDFYCVEQFCSTFYPHSFSASSCPNSEQIHVVYRDDVIPKMRYRTARFGDNDAIVELVDLNRPDVKQELGDFYIAEELMSESSKSVLVITEISHITAGFIWLNGHVDILTLLQNFELKPFGNLIKFNPNKRFKEKQIVVTTTKRRHVNKLFAHGDIEPIIETLEKELSTIDEEENKDLLAFNNDEFKKRSLYFKKLPKFIGKLQSQDCYIQLRKRRCGIFYNIPEGNNIISNLESASNVFAIHLFGLKDCHDLRRLFRFLLTAFGAFPDRDYCLLSISVAQTMTPILFEMLKYFIRVVPQAGCKIDEHLYITQRSAIYGDLQLFPVRKEDTEAIQQLLSKETPETMAMPRKMWRQSRMSTIASRMTATTSNIYLNIDNENQMQYDMEVVMSILENIFQEPFSKYQSFTIKCGDSTKAEQENVLVGFVLLRPFNSSWCLEEHFILTKSKEEPMDNIAEIMIFKLHPLFHYQADVIFRELARISNNWHFYHFRSNLRQCLSNDFLLNMQPLEPRRMKKLWFTKGNSQPLDGTDNATENDLHTPIDFFNDHFAAFQNNLGHSTYFGHTMNIVILGFTDICKAFLRLLLFSWHEMGNVQSINNCLPHIMISVICNPGVMEAEYESSFKCESCKNHADCWVNYRNCDAFVRDVTERMDVRTWVKFVSGKVKAIDTEKHLIKLETKCEIFYETLLLMCSIEYGISKGMINTENIPANYIVINNRYDKLLFYHSLRMFQKDVSSSPITVVYGSHVRSFEFINFLLKHGVEASCISLVMPYQVADSKKCRLLNDSSMDIRIEVILREMVEDLGVKVYEAMNLQELKLQDDFSNVKSASFKSFLGDRELTLICDFFVSYCEKYMSDDLMELIEAAGLETKDSFVMVNEHYRTSVDGVYAVGNFIKHNKEPNHQYRFVSPQEAAEKLILALELNALQVPHKEDKYSKPYYFQAQLPMENFFIKITMPKRYLANHLDNEYGFPLITYYEGDFSRVRLNEHDIVEEIVIVTKKNKNYDFLKFFCGRHELLLNNLRSRWYLKEIDSFLEYFQEPWVELIMNDNFEALQKLNKLLILPAAQQMMKLKVDRNVRRKIMHSYCQDMGVTSQLEFAFLEFLREHRDEFQTDIALPEDFPGPHKYLEY